MPVRNCSRVDRDGVQIPSSREVTSRVRRSIRLRHGSLGEEGETYPTLSILSLEPCATNPVRVQRTNQPISGRS